MRRRHPEHIDDIVKGLLRDLEQKKIKKASAIGEAWVKTAGIKGIEHTRPISLQKGLLMVIVENSTWLYSLTLEKSKIIKKFNEEYTGRQKVRDIRFRVGNIQE